jgi:hypothetical protein
MNKVNPIGAHAVIRWLDTGEEGDSYYFSFGEYDEDNEPDHDSHGVRDDKIFFYCEDEASLKSYMTEGMEDFVVVNYELEYKENI